MTRIGPFHTLSTLSTARPFSDFLVYAVNASSPFLVEKTFHGAAEVRRSRVRNCVLEARTAPRARMIRLRDLMPVGR